jgi:hypothetical protein
LDACFVKENYSPSMNKPQDGSAYRTFGRMNVTLQKLLVAVVAAAISISETSAEEPLAAVAASANGARPGAAIELAAPTQEENPCLKPEILASPSRPTWTGGAATTQCGVIESDFGWMLQPMGGGVRQSMLLSSVRYGLTSRMDVRWGLPGNIAQTGGTPGSLKGITDQSLSALYRFHDQGFRFPALAFSYGIEFPTGNPAKGFGSGYFDHQLALVASRDLGRAHADFNAVGTIAGGRHGQDGSTQLGLGFSVAVSPKLTLLLDNFGGSQPGTKDRFGAVLGGATWNVHSWMVVDAAFTQAYTAGAPRRQFTVGVTYSMRPGLGFPLSRSKLLRLCGV